MTVSETKFTTDPPSTSHTTSASPATRKAVQAARVATRAGSPLAASPRVAPMSREMAEVTVTAVCFELQKSQKTRPEKRQA
jgi:hypothetical protein